MNHMLKKSMPFTLFLSFMLLLAACSGNTANNGNANSGASATPEPTAAAEETSGRTVYPLVVDNFALGGEGAGWQDKQQTFDKAPERVVANTQPAAELLIRLGLTDKIVGVAALYSEGSPDIAEEFAKIPVLSKEYVGKELVVGADPELVIGRADLFADADWGVGTVEGLNELGIKTYMQSTGRKGATVDALYKDIETLGQIFDVQEKAGELIASYKEKAAAIKAAAPSDEQRTFAYISMGANDTVAVYSGINDTYQSDALGLLNLKNAFGDVEGEISVEKLVEANPDILLYSNYAGGPDLETTVAAIYAAPALQSMTAIQNKQIQVINFDDFWGYGPEIFVGVEKLGDNLKK
jgi:iron complex transport system substrate-binding protein